jgi:hypothetical protein
MKMRNWYDGITSGQKLFLFALSIILVFVYGIGLIPLCILIYCELGARDSLVVAVAKARKNGVPEKGDPDYLDWANKQGRWADKNPD